MKHLLHIAYLSCSRGLVLEKDLKQRLIFVVKKKALEYLQPHAPFMHVTKIIMKQKLHATMFIDKGLKDLCNPAANVYVLPKEILSDISHEFFLQAIQCMRF